MQQTHFSEQHGAAEIDSHGTADALNLSGGVDDIVGAQIVDQHTHGLNEREGLEAGV